MSHNIDVFTTAHETQERLGHYLSWEEGQTPPREAVVRLGGTVLDFAEVVFPDGSYSEVLGLHVQREPEGRGAHFDVYDDLVRKVPWIAVYNLTGTNNLRATELSDELGVAYDSMYPEPTEQARAARRDFSKISIEAKADSVRTGVLGERQGLLLPQIANAPYLIHDVVPQDRSNPGHFVKLVLPDSADQIKRLTEDHDYKPLEILLEDALVRFEGSVKPTLAAEPEQTADTTAGGGTSRRPRLPFGPLDRRPRAPRAPTKSPCNLD